MRAKLQHEGADPVADARRMRAIAKDVAASFDTLEALLNLYETKIGTSRKSSPECQRLKSNVVRSTRAGHWNVVILRIEREALAGLS